MDNKEQMNMSGFSSDTSLTPDNSDKKNSNIKSDTSLNQDNEHSSMKSSYNSSPASNSDSGYKMSSESDDKSYGMPSASSKSGSRCGSDMEYEEDDLEVDIEEPDQNNF